MFCKGTFIPSQARSKYFKQFKVWVTTRTPLFVLADFLSVSTKTLQRSFLTFLSSPPQPQKPETKQKIWLKVDGTYFTDWGYVIVYKAGKDILFWQYAEREYSFVYEAGFRWLEEAGYTILGITSDWHGSIVRTVHWMFPNIPHQRCLVHTQRFCESFLTQNPKTEAGKQLRELILYLNIITNPYERQIWLNWFKLWEKRFLGFIKERTYGTKENGMKTWWYTHGNVRRVYKSLTSTQDHLFLYLDHEGLDKDTNGLESEFNHLKAKITAHTGMRKHRRENFISWYLYLKNQ